jgi:hypothetical protein
MFSRQELSALYKLVRPTSEAEALWVNDLFTRAHMAVTEAERQPQGEAQPAPIAPEQVNETGQQEHGTQS